MSPLPPGPRCHYTSRLLLPIGLREEGGTETTSVDVLKGDGESQDGEIPGGTVPCSQENGSDNDTNNTTACEKVSRRRRAGVNPSHYKWKEAKVILNDTGIQFWSNVISILDIDSIEVVPADDIENLSKQDGGEGKVEKVSTKKDIGELLVYVHLSSTFVNLPDPSPPFFSTSRLAPHISPPSRGGSAPSGDRGQSSLLFSIPSKALGTGPTDEDKLKEFRQGIYLVKRAVDFLTYIRPLFRDLRHRAALGDRVRGEFQARQQAHYQNSLGIDSSRGCSTVGGASVQQLAESFLTELPSEGVEAVKSGFLLRDCAALEEAIAYAPLVVYEHLERALPRLPQVPADPQKYRVWRQVLTSPKEPAPTTPPPGHLSDAKGSERIANSSPRSNQEQSLPPSSTSVAASLQAKPVSGGECCCPSVETQTEEAGRKKISSISTSSKSVSGAATPCFRLSGGACRFSKGEITPCEDAYFYLEEEGAFGVFDGVGSWASEGVDASKFSTGLAETCVSLIKEKVYFSSPSFHSLGVNARARQLLSDAHSRVCLERPDAWGSSTAVVGVLDRRSGKLGVACLGDSVLMVLRRQMLPRSMQFRAPKCASVSPIQFLSTSPAQVPRLIRKIRWRTTEQRWANGAPFQLSNLPAEDEWENLRAMGHDRFVDVLQRIDTAGDSADMAEGASQPLVVQPGDLILLFSDGVADNLFDKEIEIFASLAVSPEEARIAGLSPEFVTTAQDVAEMIAKVARRRAADRAFNGPFVPAAVQGARHAPMQQTDGEPAIRKGAKRDDISCVAIWVEGPPPPSSTPSCQPPVTPPCSGFSLPSKPQGGTSIAASRTKESVESEESTRNIPNRPESPSSSEALVSSTPPRKRPLLYSSESQTITSCRARRSPRVASENSETSSMVSTSSAETASVVSNALETTASAVPPAEPSDSSRDEQTSASPSLPPPGGSPCRKAGESTSGLALKDGTGTHMSSSSLLTPPRDSSKTSERKTVLGSKDLAGTLRKSPPPGLTVAPSTSSAPTGTTVKRLVKSVGTDNGTAQTCSSGDFQRTLDLATPSPQRSCSSITEMEQRHGSCSSSSKTPAVETSTSLSMASTSKDGLSSPHLSSCGILKHPPSLSLNVSRDSDQDRTVLADIQKRGETEETTSTTPPSRMSLLSDALLSPAKRLVQVASRAAARAMSAAALTPPRCSPRFGNHRNNELGISVSKEGVPAKVTVRLGKGSGIKANTASIGAGAGSPNVMPSELTRVPARQTPAASPSTGTSDGGSLAHPDECRRASLHSRLPSRHSEVKRSSTGGTNIPRVGSPSLMLSRRSDLSGGTVVDAGMPCTKKRRAAQMGKGCLEKKTSKKISLLKGKPTASSSFGVAVESTEQKPVDRGGGFRTGDTLGENHEELQNNEEVEEPASCASPNVSEDIFEERRDGDGSTSVARAERKGKRRCIDNPGDARKLQATG
ncbi:serine threonine specific protein phosphatase [Cystoisospora suis]|uniref:Serine threonine specific protein phosphatase n=1 Tax=Cystoisospora suis TaxID=483139 RepID=A0A2C6KQ98_9APIC|nr:serine threonine specific protein phosphatase [Cystoisospora suis]